MADRSCGRGGVRQHAGGAAGAREPRHPASRFQQQRRHLRLPGTASPSARAEATGTSPPATATTEDSSSCPRRGGPTAEPGCLTSTPARSRSESPRTCVIDSRLGPPGPPVHARLASVESPTSPASRERRRYVQEVSADPSEPTRDPLFDESRSGVTNSTTGAPVSCSCSSPPGPQPHPHRAAGDDAAQRMHDCAGASTADTAVADHYHGRRSHHRANNDDDDDAS